MRRALLTSLTLPLFGFAGAAFSADVDVMTQNQYLGADLNAVVEAGAAVPFDPVAFNGAVLDALATVAANLPEQRYVVLADEISKRSPQLVGLQEVFDFSCVGPGCAFAPIAGAFNDHLQGTLDALQGQYVAKAVVKNLDITLPILTPIGGAQVTVVDRDVILVRSDLAGSVSIVPYGAFCGHPSLDGCNYDVVAETSINGNPVRVERGFVGVDVDVAGVPYRFVNTHLEVREPEAGNPFSRIIQTAQAYQLILTVTNTTPPGTRLIVVGDINSDPRDPPLPVPPALQPVLGTDVIVPPYAQFALAGFTDAWTLRPGTATAKGSPVVGYSCCQLEDLSNHNSMHYERIDMIFSLTAPKKVMDARLLGDVSSAKTWPPGLGLWPSDHSAVAATLQY